MTAKPFHSTTCDTTTRDDNEARPGMLQSEAPATAEISTPKQGNQKRGGAPRGNQNAVRSGLRGSKLPEGARSEEIKLHDLRKLLRGLVANDDGKVSDLHEMAIQAALRHEMTALLSIRWLRLEADGHDGKPMPLDSRLNLLATVTRATEARDRIVADLGLKPAATRSDASLPSYAREANR